MRCPNCDCDMFSGNKYCCLKCYRIAVKEGKEENREEK
jgi:hypothetical protein